ncbi:MAG: preprotein translocase subunit TatA [Firmicutes bacterium]|nr:preprotein translocase subunit TatA [Bacillota bacterium]
MWNVGMPELVLILVIALVVFGPSKLPDIGKAVGKSIREFKAATNGEEDKKAMLLEGSQKEQAK